MEILTAKLTNDGVRLNGKTNLPDGNTGHIRTAYDKWLAAGNTPAPLDVAAPTTTTTQQLIAALEEQVTPRNLRGAALGDTVAIAMIQDIETQIGKLREQAVSN